MKWLLGIGGFVMFAVLFDAAGCGGPDLCEQEYGGDWMTITDSTGYKSCKSPSTGTESGYPEPQLD